MSMLSIFVIVAALILVVLLVGTALGDRADADNTKVYDPAEDFEDNWNESWNSSR